ncbi:MAG: PBSX family phage terminase large subunit [Ruminococcus flavefaciens]|nr:PBSX family phage terminase large subunit [Ruminococcus flavefaciens]
MIYKDIELSKVIAPHFFELHKDIKNHNHTHYWIDGGRGSTKSSFVSEEILLLLKKNPQTHALVMRKVAATIKDSVYSQILWAIDTLGLNDEFAAKLSPLEIIHKKTGQKIFFRGADDPLKIKSIKPNFGYIGIGWYEELDQFYGMEEIRNINQSIMRGGDRFWMFYSFNPPKSRDNWVNVEKLEEYEERINHHSTYLGVPKEWLGEPFFKEANALKEKRPSAYEHEYLGIATGTGGAVFENVKKQKISDEEIFQMQYFKYGIDFGFALDPFAWGKLYYDRKHRILYILDEIYEEKLKNSAAAKRIIEKKNGRMYIIADSAEPKSIAEMRDYGLNIQPCKKGPDSVEHGIKWLQDLEAIIIDPSRTPNAYKEFTLYEYEMNRNGEYISAYPDKNNHFIDLTRYALEQEIQSTGWGMGVRGF